MGTEYPAIGATILFTIATSAWLGHYMYRVFSGQRTTLDPVLVPIEQIIEDEQSQGRGTNWVALYIENYGSENVRIARRLLKAAALVDEINVSTDDLNAIS